METDSLYLALPQKELGDCIRHEMKAEWQSLRSNDCVDSFIADAVANIFPRTCCVKYKQQGKKEPGFITEEFRCTEMLCLSSKTCSCYDVTSDELKFGSKVLNKRLLEQSGDGPLEKYGRVWNETVNFTSNNRGFGTSNHSVATDERITKSLSYLYPKATSREWWNSHVTA